MPIDCSKYPANWKTEIRPAILKRAGNRCERCGVKNHAIGYREKSGAFVECEGLQAEVVGAESLGNLPGRECKIEWIEQIVEQCQAANVPVFVKQIHLNGKLVKDIEKFPEHLQIRQVPWKNFQ